MVHHTPGPWQPFDTDGKPVNDPSVTSEKHVIATVWINDLSRKQAVANTHLLAAAPNMLAELRRDLEFAKGVVSYLKATGDTRDVLFTSAQSRVASIRIAIAKCEGR